MCIDKGLSGPQTSADHCILGLSILIMRYLGYHVNIDKVNAYLPFHEFEFVMNERRRT